MFHIFQNGGIPLSPTPLSLLSLYFQLKLTKHDSSVINKVTLLMLKYFDRLKIVWENASQNLAQEPVYAMTCSRINCREIHTGASKSMFRCINRILWI